MIKTVLTLHVFACKYRYGNRKALFKTMKADYNNGALLQSNGV